MKFFLIVEENESLLYLNLSWNLIRSYASIALLRGIEVEHHSIDIFPWKIRLLGQSKSIGVGSILEWFEL